MIDKVNGFMVSEVLVLSVNQRLPRFLWDAWKGFTIQWIQFNIMLSKVGKKIVSSKDFCNPAKYPRDTVAMEEWLPTEYHGGEYVTNRPHIHGVVVFEMSKQ